MNLSKNIIAIYCFSILALVTSCSKNNADTPKPYATLILGKWKAVKYINNITYNGSLLKDTVFPDPRTYADHRSDGKVYSEAVSFTVNAPIPYYSFYYDTSYYKVVDDYIVSGKAANPYRDTTKINLLTKDSLTLYSRALSPGTIYETWLFFTK